MFKREIRELNPNEAKFVSNYLGGMNQIEAARNAGYKCPRTYSAKLMARDCIKREISKQITAVKTEYRADLDEIMDRLSAIARTAINPETGEVYTELDRSSPNLAVNRVVLPNGKRVEIAPREKILVDFARHFGAFIHKTEHKVEVSVVDEFEEAERRLQAYRDSLKDGSIDLPSADLPSSKGIESGPESATDRTPPHGIAASASPPPPPSQNNIILDA